MFYALHYGKAKKPVATVRCDATYPAMWRVHMPDGHVSDMVNMSRAKDAAMVMARRRDPDLERAPASRFIWKRRESA